MSGFWPDDVQCGVAFTFDLDAETMWLERAEVIGESPVMLSEGAYGPKTGIPRILNLLERLGVDATFFLPGKIIENYTDVSREIVHAGHEIGYHSYLHKTAASVEEERQEIQQCKKIMKDLLGVVPRGYRAPGFEVLPGGLDVVAEEGFAYSTNFMDCDHPYVHRLNEGRSLVELPVDWIFDDSAHFFFTFHEPSRGPISTPARVLEMWKAEFDGIYDEGGCMILTIHPQISGRISRVRMLGELIQYMQSRPKVMIAPAGELASAVRIKCGQ